MALYVQYDDVANRYEGDMPEDRQDWVELRIEDAENELIGLVPSLADPTLVDAARAGRVRRLICDKVLNLFRNPDGALTTSDTLGPMTQSRTLPGSRVSAQSWVSFTDEELARVGYVKSAGTVNSAVLRAYYYPPVA